MRICSLIPSATEITFALGLGDALTGVTHECDYPSEAKDKPVVVRGFAEEKEICSSELDRRVRESLQAGKSLYTIDMNRLKEAIPDLIITQELCDVCAVSPSEINQAVQALPHKPQVLSLSPSRLADILKDIHRLGKATGRIKEATALVEQLSIRLDQVRAAIPSRKQRPRVTCLEWLDPLYCAGHWVPEMVELAGGLDLLGKPGEPSRKVGWSEILSLNPEIIILMPCGFTVARTMKEIHLLQRLPKWNKIPAIRKGQVFIVNGSAYFNRPGPRLVDGVEILAQILQPELFPWKASEEAAVRVF